MGTYFSSSSTPEKSDYLPKSTSSPSASDNPPKDIIAPEVWLYENADKLRILIMTCPHDKSKYIMAAFDDKGRDYVSDYKKPETWLNAVARDATINGLLDGGFKPIDSKYAKQYMGGN